MDSDVKNEIGKKSIELTILNKHIKLHFIFFYFSILDIYTLLKYYKIK